MITKKDIICLKPLWKGPFFQEFIVCFAASVHKPRFFKLRAMSKRSIVKNKQDERMVMHELYIRSNLRHPFLVNQVCAFQDYDNLFYITEYAGIRLLDKSMFSHPFSVPVVRFYASEIISCLLYLHSKQQIYTFLSPDNLFLGIDGHIKLDFSFCNNLNKNPDDMSVYAEYASPAYSQRQIFSFASDFWSLGIVLFQMTAGYTPFGSETPESTVNAMIARELEFPGWFDQDLRSLIEILLTPSLFSENFAENSELLKSHAFFVDTDWNKVELKELEPPYTVKIPEVSFKGRPSLDLLYTSDFIVNGKDGYGGIFATYSTITHLHK